ncbi:MAG: translation elongation factor Ts [Patescibacteria group bacterium]|jgi:elongation factor Ts
MEIKASDVKKLRDLAGSGMMDAKKALAEANGDADKALAILKEKGAAIAASKSERNVSQGLVVTYIHPGDKIGAMVEVNCETDFVARGDDFKKLAKQIATHVAGMQPLYVAPEDVPADVIAAEKELYKSQVAGKAKDVADKAIAGKLEGFYESVCLLRQPFVLDQDKKIEDLINELVRVVKENIKVARFVRFEVGDR